jgi:hypothetical protein
LGTESLELALGLFGLEAPAVAAGADVAELVLEAFVLFLEGLMLAFPGIAGFAKGIGEIAVGALRVVEGNGGVVHDNSRGHGGEETSRHRQGILAQQKVPSHARAIS